jgi:cell division septation protein DedD
MSNMSNYFTPDADDQMPEKKSSQQLLLLLLLLLVVLFAYLYFFTGLIKPRGEEPKPQPIAEAPVKKPLPPRPNVAKEGVPAKTVVKAEEHKVATPAAQSAPPAKPGAVATTAPAAKPATHAKEIPAAKPAVAAKEASGVKPAPAKPGNAPAQAKAVKPPVPAVQAKGTQPVATPATQAKSPAGTEKKAVATAEKKGAAKSAVPVKVAAKETGSEKAAAGAPAAGAAIKKSKPVAKPAVAAYALEIVGDLAESELAPVMAKLKQAGVTHVVKSKQLKGEPMHRLFLADFANRDEALEELERLKLATTDAFLLRENGRFAVYAGSYLREAKANSEQSRLQAKGVQLLLKSATAPVSVLRVRAGAFAHEAEAEKAAKSLKKSGLSLKVVKLAKAEK